MNPFLGEVRLFPWTFAPRGWALCQGQIMAINQNTALFSLLGTTYGGDGIRTFALPDLRGRVPTHFGSTYVQGTQVGTETVTLTTATMPAHPHTFFGTSANANQKPPGGVLATDSSAAANFYAPDTTPFAIGPVSIGSAGGSQPHANMQPYLVMNYCIATTGIFPSRS